MHKTYRWLREYVFYSVPSTLVTLFFLYSLIHLCIPLFAWLSWNSNFIGNGPQDCDQSGACWVFIKVRFNQFMYGFYPAKEQWRINITYVLAIIGTLGVTVPRMPYKKYTALFLLIPYPILCLFLYTGGIWGLEPVPTAKWGGLHLTLVISVVGISLSLPFGILLALGRRSTMPLVKSACIFFIELWRGVPLISVLFMASVMIPLFLPEEIYFDKLLRALIGIVLFASAYMAEVIRGGLQTLPVGQYEAAQALGLNYWQMQSFIILPQALKQVIPGIVNTFIGLFKDTTLILIINLFDLLGMIQAANTDPKWLAYNVEGYLFAGFVFWLFCFGMSRYSIHLEHHLKIGKPR